MATLYAQQSDLQLSRAFEAGHSATTMALVHTKKIKAYPRKETMYTLAYVYQIDSTVYRSHYQCNCPVLRDVLEGSEIQVTYQLTDPQNSRPTLVNYNPSGLSFGVAFSWILTIGGAIGSTYLLLTRGKT